MNEHSDGSGSEAGDFIPLVIAHFIEASGEEVDSEEAERRLKLSQYPSQEI